ncbi:MAG: hypothetical protein QOF17_1215 [Solirubrobacteraceae bacterium]|nr:hypothetical protein [Solirubrobacteraceae bacterium]
MQVYENRSRARSVHPENQTSPPNFGPWWRQILEAAAPDWLLCHLGLLKDQEPAALELTTMTA